MIRNPRFGFFPLSHRPLRRFRLAIALGLFIGAFTAQAKLPEGATPRETESLAIKAMNAGAYQDAIPFLTQLISWLKGSEKYANKVERFRFQLGLCNYLTANFPAAQKSFEEYLKKHRRGNKAPEAAVYLGDCMRFSQKLKDAAKCYKKALKDYSSLLNSDWKADIYCSIARCHLAEENWKGAIPALEKVYRYAPDSMRTNWAATLLTVAYLKEQKLDKVYELVPYLMNEDSFVGRSIPFNLSALEVGDGLFADENYRDALWIYRLVNPRSQIEKRAKREVRRIKDLIEDLREYGGGGQYREILRAQESLGESEGALKALKEVKDYDTELNFRMARAYMEISRFREARALFLHLRGILEKEQAEEPLYLAFVCSTSLQPWDRAFEIGKEYLTDYPHPAGEHYDNVSLTVGQMRAAQKEWPAVIEVLTTALEVHPEHESIAECMFLIGYASFMEEKFQDAIKWLKELNEKYPEHERCEEATYWLAMSYLFEANYAEALSVFGNFINAFPDSVYAEDANFRYAVCLYGLSRFPESETKLLEFNENYSASKLRGEALMMLADISGTTGKLQQAVERFAQAIACEENLNIELYNYCNFRRGEMLKDLEDFDGIIDHFSTYIARKRDGSNIPMAIYWVAQAKWQKGEQKEAMKYLLEAVDVYGRDPAALGIDMILQEWVGRSRNLPPEDVDNAWKNFRHLADDAAKEGEKTLELRLKHILYVAPPKVGEEEEKQKKEKSALREELLQPGNVAVASPTLLEFMVDEGEKDGKTQLATSAAEMILEKFPETDYSIAARMCLARREIAAERFYIAEKHLGTIREVFATSDAAAEALIMLGDMYLTQKKYQKADKCYRDVLGVREWRGPKWPRAIYGRGECAREQRKYLKASAHYERIYLLYTHYREWCAKAYFARAQCLLKLNKNRETKEVLATMLANQELAEYPEYEEAKKVLTSLGGN